MSTPDEIGDTNEIYEEEIFPYKATKTIHTDLIHTKLEIEPIWKTAELKGKATLILKPHFMLRTVFLSMQKEWKLNL